MAFRGRHVWQALALAVLAAVAVASPAPPGEGHAGPDTASSTTPSAADHQAAAAARAYFTPDVLEATDAAALDEYAQGDPSPQPADELSATAFAGLPDVGRLYIRADGGDRTCTASVVHRRGGDLIMSAAHCLYHLDMAVFFPAYDRGASATYGEAAVFPGTVTVDHRWATTHDDDLDFAFALVDRDVEASTGALVPRVAQPLPPFVQVVGYPSSNADAGRPITCTAHPYVPTGVGAQLEFACGAFYDGTSGGPWIVPGTHEVIGVIGGHDEGGLSPDFSYSSLFDRDLMNLYALFTGPARTS